MQKDGEYHLQDIYDIKSNNFLNSHNVMEKRRQINYLFKTNTNEFLSDVFDKQYLKTELKVYTRAFYKIDNVNDLNIYQSPSNFY